MTYIFLSILIQVILIIHVIKTCRNQIWIWVLALLSIPGAIAYIVVELLPDVFAGRTAQRTARGLKKAHARRPPMHIIDFRSRILLASVAFDSVLRARTRFHIPQQMVTSKYQLALLYVPVAMFLKAGAVVGLATPRIARNRGRPSSTDFAHFIPKLQRCSQARRGAGQRQGRGRGARLANLPPVLGDRSPGPAAESHADRLWLVRPIVVSF